MFEIIGKRARTSGLSRCYNNVGHGYRGDHLKTRVTAEILLKILPLRVVGMFFKKAS